MSSRLMDLSKSQTNLISTTYQKVIPQAFPNRTKPYSKDYRVIYFSQTNKTKQKRNYPNNYITTSKYTLINYLPKSILLQFKRYANIYFLIIMILQCIKIVSPLNPITAVGPLLLVLAISVIREGIEDYRRHKEDAKENAEKVYRYNARSQIFQETESKNLEVGDVIVVIKDSIIPADCLLLFCSNQSKIAYVMTANLDGEKNLKPRYCQPTLFSIFSRSNEFFRMRGKLKYTLPDPELPVFNGTIYINSNSMHKLEVKHVIYKGTMLANTDYAIAMILYTGKDTKIVMNSQKGKPKQSHLEGIVNYLIGLIFLIQICLCLFLALLNSGWYANNCSKHTYLLLNIDYMDTRHFSGFIGFLSYLLLLNTMIPISLIVTLEIVKYSQAYFMDVDCDMFSKIKNRFALCNSCSLNEELGQIKYIFSDKTGTLTANKLEFAACAIGNELFGMTEQELENSDGKTLEKRKEKHSADTKVTNKAVPIVYSFPDSEIKQYSIFGKNGQEFNISLTSISKKSNLKIENTKDLVRHFLYCLSLNHSCFVEKTPKKGTNVQEPKILRMNTKTRRELIKNLQNPPLKNKTDSMTSNLLDNFDKYHLNYSGENPDEIILCDTARRLGFIFIGGDEAHANLRITRGSNGRAESFENQRWNILKTIPFSSARGKMSIIVKKDNLIILYCKGGNSKIAEVLKPNDQPFYASVNEKSRKLSEMGLRVLWIAMKIIDSDEYETWRKEYDLANTSNTIKESELNDVIKKIELGMTLIGCTAVEDHLQDQVPMTIRDLQTAGVNIWVLTGDNLPTAKNITISCQLLPANMDLYEIYADLEKFQAFVRIKCKDENVFSQQNLATAGERIAAFETCYKDAYVVPVPQDTENKEAYIHNIQERKAILLLGLENLLVRYKRSEVENPGILRGVLIEAAMLSLILPGQDFKRLAYYLHPLSRVFLDLSLNSQAVVCCRVSPMQKALVVRMIKRNIKGAITLAIGDGANDVSMIKEADVGVGIFGEEGTQAAMSSDYAIGEFKSLKKLMLFHGRINYIRIADMILYFFFKNFLFTIPQFYYAFYSAFSGQTLYDDWFVSLYNMIFTACPLLFYALLDQDINDDDGEFIKSLIPYTFYQGRECLIFNFTNFFWTIFNSIAQSIIVFFFTDYMMFYSIPLNYNGHVADYWAVSLTQFTSIIFIVNYKILVMTRYHTIVNVLIIIITSYGAYIGYFCVSSLFDYSKSSATMNSLFTYSHFYLIIFICSSITFLLDKGIQFAKLNFFDEPITLLRRHRTLNFGNKNERIQEENNLRTRILNYDEKVRNLHKVQRINPEYMAKN